MNNSKSYNYCGAKHCINCQNNSCNDNVSQNKYNIVQKKIYSDIIALDLLSAIMV